MIEVNTYKLSERPKTKIIKWNGDDVIPVFCGGALGLYYNGILMSQQLNGQPIPLKGVNWPSYWGYRRMFASQTFGFAASMTVFEKSGNYFGRWSPEHKLASIGAFSTYSGLQDIVDRRELGLKFCGKSCLKQMSMSALLGYAVMSIFQSLSKQNGTLIDVNDFTQTYPVLTPSQIEQLKIKVSQIDQGKPMPDKLHRCIDAYVEVSKPVEKYVEPPTFYDEETP